MRNALPALVHSLLVGAALLACAGGSHHQLSPDTYAIACKRNASNCYEEAARACPDGFDVLDSKGHNGAIVTSHATGQTTNVVAYPTYDGEMLVRCRAAVAQAAASSAPPVPTSVFTAEPRPNVDDMLPPASEVPTTRR